MSPRTVGRGCAAALVAVGALAAVGCGGDAGDTNPDSPSTTAADATPTAEALYRRALDELRSARSVNLSVNATYAGDLRPGPRTPHQRQVTTTLRATGDLARDALAADVELGVEGRRTSGRLVGGPEGVFFQHADRWFGARDSGLYRRLVPDYDPNRWSVDRVDGVIAALPDGVRAETVDGVAVFCAAGPIDVVRVTEAIDGPDLSDHARQNAKESVTRLDARLCMAHDTGRLVRAEVDFTIRGRDGRIAMRVNGWNARVDTSPPATFESPTDLGPRLFAGAAPPAGGGVDRRVPAGRAA